MSSGIHGSESFAAALRNARKKKTIADPTLAVVSRAWSGGRQYLASRVPGDRDYTISPNPKNLGRRERID